MRPRVVDSLQPTPFLQRFSSKMAQAAGNYPVIDVACGTGRNGIFLAQLGIKVVFIDKDLSRLPADGHELHPLTLTRQRCDLITDPWPFRESTVGGIVLIDFLHLPLIPRFEHCLTSGGLLLLETVSGRGENYRELPRVGELRAAVQNGFEIDFYRESPCGPAPLMRVSVKMVVRRL